MLNLKTLVQTTSSSLNQKSPKEAVGLKDERNGKETLKIRFGTWLLMATYCLLSPAFQASTNYPLFSALIVGLALHLNAIYRQSNEAIQAIFHIVNSTLIAAIVYEGSNYSYFSLILPSSGHLALFCIQDYAYLFSFMMVINYLSLHWFYSDKLFELYEPITDSYRLPAQGFENITTEWVVSILITLTVLITLKRQIVTGIKICKAVKNKADNTNQELTEIKSRFTQNINQLNLLTEKLEKALRSQEILVACVSHELRNPLNGILGSLDILNLEVKDEHQTDVLRRCQVCGEGLLNQINNLLDVAKINCGNLEIQSKAVKMSGFLSKFWTLTNNKIENKQIKFFILVDKNMPLWLNLDAQRVQQALDNIMDNAIKFTSAGSIRVIFSWVKEKSGYWNSRDSIRNLDDSRSSFETEVDFAEFDEGLVENSFMTLKKRERKSIRSIENFITIKPCISEMIEETVEAGLLIPVAVRDGYLKITVLDTGCGVAKAAQEKIFDPFSEMDKNFLKNYAGTGFGLYIVKQILERMGGEIKLRSVEGLGTSLKIVVPVQKVSREDEIQILSSKKVLSDGELTKNSSAQKTQRYKGKTGSEASLMTSCNRRALVVDDDSFNQNLMKEYLRKLNCEVDIASNGLEGLELYKKDPWRYRFITMDIQMPVMDGITAAKEIRKFGEASKIKAIPIVFITANCSSDKDPKEIFGLENIENTFYFPKPFRFLDCKSFVDKILTPTDDDVLIVD